MLWERMVADSVLSQASRCSPQALERGSEGGVTVRSGTRFAEGDSMRRGGAGTKSLSDPVLPLPPHIHSTAPSKWYF